MPLSTVKLPGKRSRALELYEVMRASIIDGSLEPGERLVETAIAEHFEMSRTPVREALHKLSVDGLTLDTAQGLVVAGITDEAFASYCAVREVLEGMAARLAAENRTEVELRAMERMVKEMEAPTIAGEVAELAALSSELHETIALASRNPYLFKLINELKMFINRSHASTFIDDERRRDALLEHQQILRAIRERDAAAADELSRHHFAEIMAVRLTMRRRRQRKTDS